MIYKIYNDVQYKARKVKIQNFDQPIWENYYNYRISFL